MTTGTDRRPSTTGESDAGEATPTDRSETGKEDHHYWRFAAMIATSTGLMLVLMFLNTYAWDHVRWSETRLYMALLMGATMALVMLGFMLGMYRNSKVNTAIAVGAVLVFVGSLYLVRSQSTVDDASWMSAMIPHHSIAVLTSENAGIEDHRACELAVEIIEAQQREIDEMSWLISDIEENGPARSAEDAADRPVPEFEGSSIRSC